MGSGISAQFGIGAPETTMGTAVAITRFYEFDNEGLDSDLARVDGQGLHAGGLGVRAARSVQTTRTAGGPVTMDLPTNGLGLLMQQCLASYGQTLATPTQIGTTGAYKQVHQPALTGGKTFTLQKGAPTTGSTVEPYTYVGAKVVEWTVSCEAGGLAKLAVTFDAWDELTTATTPAGAALAAATYPTSKIFHFKQGALYVGGTASTTAGLVSIAGGTLLASVSSFTMTHSRRTKNDRFFLGNSGRKDEQLENALQQPTGSLGMEFTSRAAVYDLYRANTSAALRLAFTDDVGTAGTGQANTFELIIPSVKINGETPKVGGPDIVGMTAPFAVYEDGTNAMLQATIISADTVL